MAARFVEAYHLRYDAHAARVLDEKFSDFICNASQEALPPAFGTLNDAQQRIARAVRCGHAAANLMTTSVAARSKWMLAQAPDLVSRLQTLYAELGPALGKLGAQMVVSGAMASHLHARRLGYSPEGIEPLWRIVIKIQFSRELDGAWACLVAGVNAVKGTVAPILDVQLNTNHHVLNAFDKGGPLVLKIRFTKHGTLPPLEMIERIPVAPLRYLVADYAARAAKIDEPVAKRNLARARNAAVLLATRLSINSDEGRAVLAE